jgi:hypothetical protein
MRLRKVSAGGRMMRTRISHHTLDTGQATKAVTMEFHEGFAKAARAEGGKWSAVARTWYFDQREGETARALGKRVRAIVGAFCPDFEEL